MTDLTFAILKYAFLALLWVFVFFVVRSLGRDVNNRSPRDARKRRQKNRQAHAPASPAAATAASSMPTEPLARSTSGPARSARAGAHSPARGSSQPTVLVIVDGPLAGTTVTLTDQPITLGRAPDNAIILDDEFVSAHHARVFRDPATGSWAVEDMNSTNGTVVNGQRIRGAVMLPVGVLVRIGATTFELR
ncbi:MAG: FHA domain-containing protein [Bifidobacteriaceae bacterium]|nr:FHA domain-containing protein [Bifidobacteriaceae bacterium]